MSMGGNQSFLGEIFVRLGVAAIKKHWASKSWQVTILINDNITKPILEDHQLNKYFLKSCWCLRENLQQLSTGDLFYPYII